MTQEDQQITTLGLNRIEGFVQSGNEKCRQAVEKIHFQHEGRMRECEIVNGKFIDVDIYAVLKEK